MVSSEPFVARTLAAPRVINIADLRRLAKRRLPRVVFDYIDGGAESEVTLRENCRVFEQVTFRPRGAVAAPQTDLQTTVLGTKLALPFLLAPVGSTRMCYPRGEAVAAQAGGEAGTAYVLSTLSGCKLEEVKAATTGPCWYQVYLVGGRKVTRAAIERAQAAGFSALVVTIDTPVAGLRERDVRNGTKELVGRRPWTMLPFVWQFLARLAGFLLDGGLMRFPNVVLPDGPMAYADVGRRARAVGGVMAGPQVDPGSLERPNRGQGRAHRRGCAACRRRGRGSYRGLEPWRAPAGWRGGYAAGAAGSGRRGARTGRGPAGQGAASRANSWLSGARAALEAMPAVALYSISGNAPRLSMRILRARRKARLSRCRKTNVWAEGETERYDRLRPRGPR